MDFSPDSSKSEMVVSLINMNKKMEMESKMFCGWNRRYEGGYNIGDAGREKVYKNNKVGKVGS